MSEPALPVAIAVACGASGASLVRQLGQAQTIRQDGARRYITPRLPIFAILILSAVIAPLLTIVTFERLPFVNIAPAFMLLLLTGAAWASFAYGLRRSLGPRIAWQSGFLIIEHRFGPVEMIALAQVGQVRRALHGYRLFLRGGRNLHIHLTDRGAEALLHTIMAEVAEREPVVRPAWSIRQGRAA